jgi:hypothetical protein
MRTIFAGSRLRPAALLALAAVAVHEARYLLAFGAHTERADVAAGHAYLQLLAPLLVAVAVCAIAATLLAPVLHRRMPRLADPAAGTERAAGYALALLGIFVCQEVLEGALAGHGDVLAGIAGPGGWLALPLAIAFGALIEAAGRWLDRAELRVAGAFARPRRRRGTSAPRPAAPQLTPLCARPLAFGLGRRPPPLTVGS